MIKVDALTKKYGNFTALNSISFEIKSNCITALLGPNGAGKTTTLRILCGYLAPTSGNVNIMSLNWSEENLIKIKKSIGYVPENNPIYDDLEVSEYLEWVGKTFDLNGNDLKDKVKNSINRCSLNSVVGRKIGTLSKGYRQRVALAKAILNDPPILILDEPTSGLDPNQAEETRKLIKEIRKDKTVIISTHVLSEVEAICDEMIIINKGNIAASGTKEEIIARYSPIQTFILKIKENGKDYKDFFSKFNDIEILSENNEKVYIIKSENDIRFEISEIIRINNIPALEFYKKSVTLDEIFSKITS